MSNDSAGKASAKQLFDDAFSRNDAAEMKRIFFSPEYKKVLVDRVSEVMKGTNKEYVNDGASAAVLATYYFEAATDLLKMARARTNALERRIEDLERNPFAYDGPHETGKTYRRGTFVTHGGSLWHANYTTASTPGDGPAWTLAVKRGKDGKGNQ